MKPGKWLALGMVGGLALALGDLLWQPAAPLPQNAVAMVGNYPIDRERFEATANQIEQESRRSLSPTERQALLDRMVEEYLLLGYAKSLDLITVNPELRRRAVDLVLQTLREQTQALEPTPQELAEFVASNRGYFKTAGNTPADPTLSAPLEQIARTEWQRRQAEQMLDSLLADLRAQTSVIQVPNP